MDEMVKTVADKTGVAPETVQKVLAQAMEFVKTKLPPQYASQVESVLNSGGAGGGMRLPVLARRNLRALRRVLGAPIPRDRAPRPGREARPRTTDRGPVREIPRRAGYPRRRPVRPLLGRAADVQLPALAVGLRGILFHRYELAGLYARVFRGCDAGLCRAGPPVRRAVR